MRRLDGAQNTSRLLHLLQGADRLVHRQQELGDVAALRLKIRPQLPRRLAGLHQTRQ